MCNGAYLDLPLKYLSVQVSLPLPRRLHPLPPFKLVLQVYTPRIHRILLEDPHPVAQCLHRTHLEEDPHPVAHHLDRIEDEHHSVTQHLHRHLDPPTTKIMVETIYRDNTRYYSMINETLQQVDVLLLSVPPISSPLPKKTMDVVPSHDSLRVLVTEKDQREKKMDRRKRSATKIRTTRRRQKGGILPLAALIPALIAGGKYIGKKVTS